MKWLRRWLGSEQDKGLLEHMAKSFDQVNDAVSSNESALKTGLRRLSMAQKQQNDILERLLEESAKTRAALKTGTSVTLSHEQLLYTLDNLAKIEQAASSTLPVIESVVEQTIVDLLAHCEVTPIALLGQHYPEQACEVVGSAAHNEWPDGTVVEILQQGFRTDDGELLRPAKVIVCSTAAPAGIRGNKLQETNDAK